MTVRAAQPSFRVPAPLLALVALLGTSCLLAVAVAIFGPEVALAPLALAAVCGVVAFPRRATLVLLAAAIATDTAGIDSTEPLARAFWHMPPTLARAMPLTVSPFELLLALAAVTVLLRPSVRRADAARLPALATLVPFVLLAGAAYGLAKGAPGNLVYHEARGLIFATLTFFLAWRLRLTHRELGATAIAATTALALVVVFRYVVYLAGERSGIPREFWFGHETGLFLAFGCLLAGIGVMSQRTDGARLLFALHGLLMTTAMMMTGRRSAILVVLAGMLIAAWLLLPRRPVLLTTLGVVALFGGAGYLAVYWDATVGPLAEPARAIRSQFDPDPRDRSSDEYRRIERNNLERTISESPLFGIGFGQPFTQFEPLPELDFWPLQSYTPHQNILWLWLKTGIVGASVLIGLWVLAFGRCLRACRRVPRLRDIPATPMLLAAALFMYLAYARVDLAFVNSRSAVPLAAVFALALMLRPETDSPHA